MNLETLIQNWEADAERLRKSYGPEDNPNVTFEQKQKLMWQVQIINDLLEELKEVDEVKKPDPKSLMLPAKSIVEKVVIDECDRRYGTHYSPQHIQSAIEGAQDIVQWIFKNN